MSISLLKPISGVRVFGDIKYRNKQCPKESLSQVTFVNYIRMTYPDTYGKVLIHNRNEGLLIDSQFSAIQKHRAMGMVKGSSDIIIPGKQTFICELKREDPTLSKIELEQIDYLITAKNLGCFACVALGHKAAIEAFNEYLKGIK